MNPRVHYAVTTDDAGRSVTLRRYVNTRSAPLDTLVFSGPQAQAIGLELIAKARATMPPTEDHPASASDQQIDLTAPVPTDAVEADRQCRALMGDPRYWKQRDPAVLRRVAALLRVVHPTHVIGGSHPAPSGDQTS